MKKLMMYLIAGLFLLAMNVNAQEFYLGAEQPPDYSPVITEAQMAPMNGVVCPPCGIDEGEGDIPDDGEDVVDGGCNSDPPVFIDISIGDVICGRTNTYNYFGSSYRDTDWYRIVLTESKTLYWSSYGDVDLDIFIIADDGNCNVSSVVASDLSVPAGTLGQTSYTCGPGTWYLWVGYPGYTGVPDGANYIAHLTEGPPSDPWCTGQVPLSDWAIYMGIFLILVFTVIRVKKLI
ncbi:MAG: hypothetical protein K9G67_14865 [Bacteroidales bacterium]|nr:hypothetical protein [Bacteroidales bacterium]MCF8345066.1 hypothetical protein [Bacteroidales bacterium]MCF8377634.1 hypothetical protein [Bacteroidales bacterium]MCF8402022.1 hypothetical protein [Bacteroidales bacterium]